MVLKLHGKVCNSFEGLTDRLLIPYFPHQLLKYLICWHFLMTLLIVEGTYCSPAPCCRSPSRVLWEASNQRVKGGDQGCTHTVIVTSPRLGLFKEHSRSSVTQPQASKKTQMNLMHSYMAWLSREALASLRRNVRRQMGLNSLDGSCPCPWKENVFNYSCSA